ncbi:photosystem II reaction center PSB28 protein, chloroplastic, partial [Tanacetum coccineum]
MLQRTLQVLTAWAAMQLPVPLGVVCILIECLHSLRNSTVPEGITSPTLCHTSRSSFNGQALTMPIFKQTPRRLSRDEQTISDVKLTKSRDGPNGHAIFMFDRSSVFDSSGEVGDTTGFFMIDEEGTVLQ